jgi:HK97 family phage major capsid protein
VYFALPKVQRNNPKGEWIMSDGVHQLIRKAKDTAGRPLLSIHHDDKLLMCKKVLVSPGMSSGASAKFAVANLSQYVVRV